MSKKLLAKNWLSLAESAALLSQMTSEKYTKDDVIQFVCEGKLKVNWNLHLTPAQEVVFCSRLVPDLTSILHRGMNLPKQELDGVNEPSLDHKYTVKTNDEWKDLKCYWSTAFYAADGCGDYEPTTRLHGLYSLDIELNSGIGAYLRSILIGVEEPVVSIDGYIVSDSKGVHYRILDYLNYEDKDKACAPSYFPTDRKPELAELAFKASELADFVNSLAGHQKNHETEMISPKKENSYLRIIEALADALLDGLTDSPYTNAEACIAAMKSKGVTPPIKKDALAKYLIEAKKLKK